MPLVTSALFCETERAGRKGDRADRQPVKVKQGSALVTAGNVCHAYVRLASALATSLKFVNRHLAPFADQ